MKALVYRGSRGLAVEDTVVPRAAEGEVRVRVAAVGLCGSDVHFIQAGLRGGGDPRVLGHEFGGTLDDGQFVVVNPMVGCGLCRLCCQGSTHLCAERRVIGYGIPGAFAEHVVVPRRNAVPAASITPIQAALVEPLATAVHAYNRAGRPTDGIAIIGAGSIGMCLLHVLDSYGVRGVVVVDPVPARQQHALKAGADRVAARLEGQAFQCVFDAAGTDATRKESLACLARGGSVVLIGLHDDDMTFSAEDLIKNEVSLIGCVAYTEAEFSEAIDLTRSLDPPWVEMVPLRDAPAAVTQILEGNAPGRRTKIVFEIES